jgi:aminoglycoside phosphotransferase (APT) family kinase protein
MSARGDLWPEVAGTLTALGVEPVSVTALDSDHQMAANPRAFVIVAADGRRLKARVLPTAEMARECTVLAQRLDDPGVVVPLGYAGRVTVDPWVDGTPLSAVALTPENLRASAELLRRVHACAGADGEPLPSSEPVAPIRDRTLGWLKPLTAAGLLEPAWSLRLATLLEVSLPDVAEWGVTHGDLCASNLLVTPDGGLVSIDNELLRLGFLDFDLARTWYRWELPIWAQDVFEAEYHKHGRPQPPADQQRAWRVAATVDALYWRVEGGAPLEIPLDALKHLVIDSGVP